MKLILRHYLTALRERDELDAVLPDLLSEIGFNIITRPMRGTRQSGVDIAAVGPDPDNADTRTLFLFSIKSGNLGRADWDGTPQALRSSLNEILDSYIPNRVPQQYEELPIAICICMGGEMLEPVRENWTSFVRKNTKSNMSFREWNGDRLANMLLGGVLKQDLLATEHRLDFQKAVAMVDQPDIAYRYFSSLVSHLVSDADNPKLGTQRLRQVYIVLWVIFVWARDVNNLEAPYRASELALLRGWELCRSELNLDPKVQSERMLVLDQILKLHIIISHALIGDKIGTLVEKDYALSMAVGSQSPADVNLALFELLGRVCILGIWCHFTGVRTEDEEFQKLSYQQRDHALNTAIQVINANPCLLSPLQDDFSIEISLLLHLAQLCERPSAIKPYLVGMAARLCFALQMRNGYPTCATDYRDVVAHPSAQDDAYFEEHTKGSVLYPLLITWLHWLGAEQEKMQLATVIEKEISHTTQQVWLIGDDSEPGIWRGNHDHGFAIPGLNVSGKTDELIETLQKACEDHPFLENLSALKTGLWPLVLAASRHFRLPVPPQLWLAAGNEEVSK